MPSRQVVRLADQFTPGSKKKKRLLTASDLSSALLTTLSYLHVFLTTAWTNTAGKRQHRNQILASARYHH